MKRIVQLIKRFVGLLGQLPIIDKVLIFSKKIILPGFQGVPLYEVMKFFLESLIKGVLFQRASAMTYRIFIALIPMIVALFSVISFLGEDIKNSLLSLIESGVPDYIWPAISNIITEVVMRQNGTLFSLSFLFGIYLSIIGITSIINTLNNTYFEIENRNFIKQLLLSLGILAVLTILVILAVGIFIGTSIIIKNIDMHLINSAGFYTMAIKIFKWIFLFACLYFFISALYYIAPAKKELYRFFSAGSSMSTILMTILLSVLNLYFSKFTNFNLIYGSMGALFAILLWIYCNSVVLLIGYDLNVSIAIAQKNRKKDDDELKLS